MTPVRILVVHNEVVTEDQFEEVGVSLEGFALKDVTLVHLTVAHNESPDAVHERVTAELEHGHFDQVYVVEDEGPVTDWFEDTTIGDWRDFNIAVNTSEGYIVCYAEYSVVDE